MSYYLVVDLGKKERKKGRNEFFFGLISCEK